jgi:hypothetical protein
MDSWRLVVDELALELGALRAFEAEVDGYPELQLHPAVIATRTKVALAGSAVERANHYVESSIVAEARRALARAQDAVEEARELMYTRRPSQPGGLRLVGSAAGDVGPRMEGYRRAIVDGLRSALGPRERHEAWTLRLESFAVTPGFFAEVTAPDGRKAWWVFDAPGEPVGERIESALQDLAPALRAEGGRKPEVPGE